jgi:L-serine dehydratase
VVEEKMDLHPEQIRRALAVAGWIGAVIAADASISGAEVGCQGEIGAASAMAAGAVCYLLGGNVSDQVDRAAESALEHYLGLTCDPIDGLVQIPCIERNAAGAVSALNAASLAMISGGGDRVSFDDVVDAMRRTGHDLDARYKETALGGLAATPDVGE